MFPTLYHFLKDLFGISLDGLLMVNTFGFFVAISIAAAFWAMRTEMARRTALGQFGPVQVRTVTGKPFPVSEYVLNGVLAFLFGYKVLFLLFNSGEGFSPQDHVFTSEGSLWMGIAAALAVTAWRYRTDLKQRLPEPKVVDTTTDAGYYMGNITTIALLSGFLGAKVFHILENPAHLTFATFVSDFFSTGGWTFYGGLLCGAAGVLIYCHSKKLNLFRVLDSGAPAMMLSYGTGRFGCHFSGDGDWGVANTQPTPAGLGWLPDWAWAYTYPHNVLGHGGNVGPEMVSIPGCTGDYCHQLAVPVWPTPLYEALMALGLFFILWKVLRFKSTSPGNLFAWYMVFAGAERFLIEFIREHGSSLYRVGSLTFSQAQLISLLLLITGTVWLLFLGKRVGSTSGSGTAQGLNT